MFLFLWTTFCDTLHELLHTFYHAILLKAILDVQHYHSINKKLIIFLTFFFYQKKMILVDL